MSTGATTRTHETSTAAATTADKVVVEGVSKQFTRTQKREVEVINALENVSMTVKPGELVALTGKSGCGKTTLLRILMGLERPSGGRVTVSGREVDGPGPDRAMVFQHAELLPWRSALGNVELGLEARGIGGRQRREVAREYLGLVGLGDAMERKPYELSGGMRQRVGMARALAIQPEVLLMDEPFGALDAQTRESLQQELLRIHGEREQTIVFVTHDLDEAVLLADRIVMLAPHPGRVHAIVDVPLPRPRMDAVSIRTSEDFVKIRGDLWRLLQEADEQARDDNKTEVS
jgi:NitT/TauT family transport system ATP-binding protein